MYVMKYESRRQVMIRDLLALRADRDAYYYGRDRLW